MVVDIEVKRAPSYNVGSMMRVGPYRNDILRAEFKQLVKWVKKRKVRTGKYLLYFLDEAGDRPANKRRWEACLEIRGKAKSERKVKVKRLQAQRVASVTFDPNQVSPRLVYHGLYGWLQENGDFKEAGHSREIYPGNPWTNPRAWAKTEVQVPIKRR